MGAFEDYIDKIGSESGSMGPWLAHWRHTELFWKGIHTEEEIINLIKSNAFLKKQFKM